MLTFDRMKIQLTSDCVVDQRNVKGIAEFIRACNTQIYILQVRLFDFGKESWFININSEMRQN